MGCMVTKPSDNLELRIQRALQEIIAHKNARAAAIRAGATPEGGDFAVGADDDIQASFNRIILKFPVLRRAITGIRQAFRTFDADNSGTIDKKELGKCLAALGAHVDEKEVHHMFKYANFSHKGSLSFKEFVLCLCLGSVLQLFPLLKAYTGVTLRQESSIGSGINSAGGPTTTLNTTPILVQPAGTSASAATPASGSDAATSVTAASAAAAPSGNSTPSSTAAANNTQTAAANPAIDAQQPQPTPQQPDAALLAQGRRLVKALRIILEAYVLFDKDGSGTIDKAEVLQMIDAEQSKKHNHAPHQHSSSSSNAHAQSSSGINLVSSSPGASSNQLRSSSLTRQSEASLTLGAGLAGNDNSNKDNGGAQGRDSTTSLAASTARPDSGRGAGLGRDSTGSSVMAASTPSATSSVAAAATVPFISIPFGGKDSSSSGTGAGGMISSARKPGSGNREASGNVLLSKERWMELDHDRSGQISFAEFVFAFMDWVGIDDDDDDDDDLSSASMGGGGGGGSLLSYHPSSLPPQPSTRYSTHNTNDDAVGGGGATPAGASASGLPAPGSATVVSLGHSTSAHGLPNANAAAARRLSRGGGAAGDDTGNGSIPPIVASYTTPNTTARDSQGSSSAATSDGLSARGAPAQVGAKPAPHGILRTSRPGSASASASAGPAALANPAENSAGATSSRRSSLKASSTNAAGFGGHDSTASGAPLGSSPTSGGAPSTSLRSMAPSIRLALSSDVESGYVPPAVDDADIDAQLELPRRGHVSAAEKANQLAAAAAAQEAGNSSPSESKLARGVGFAAAGDPAAAKALALAQAAAFETAIEVQADAAGAPVSSSGAAVIAGNLRSLSALHRSGGNAEGAAAAPSTSASADGAAHQAAAHQAAPPPITLEAASPVA